MTIGCENCWCGDKLLYDARAHAARARHGRALAVTQQRPTTTLPQIRVDSVGRAAACDCSATAAASVWGGRILVW